MRYWIAAAVPLVMGMEGDVYLRRMGSYVEKPSTDASDFVDGLMGLEPEFEDLGDSLEDFAAPSNIPLTREQMTPRNILIRELLNSNMEATDQDIADMINVCLHRDRFSLTRPREVAQMKMELLAPLSIPGWLFEVFWSFRDNLSVSNPDLMNSLSNRLPRELRAIPNLIQIWKDYCVDPLELYIASEGTYPLPCEFDLKRKQYILSPGTVRNFLTHSLN